MEAFIELKPQASQDKELCKISDIKSKNKVIEKDEWITLMFSVSIRHAQ